MEIATVIKNCFRIWFHPRKVFRDIKNEGISPYFSLPFLFLLRYVHILSHLWMVHPERFLSHYRGIIIIEEGLYATGLFLLGSMTLYLFGVVLKKRVNYEAIEHGFFYILVGGIFLIVFDVPHIFIPHLVNGHDPQDFPRIYGRCTHISLFFQLTLIPAWMSFWVERFLRIKKRYTILPALLFPISLKYFLPRVTIPLWSLLIFASIMTIFFAAERKRVRAAYSLFLVLIGIFAALFPGILPTGGG